MVKFVIIFCLFFSLSVSAQQPFWNQTSGPSGGSSHFEFNSKGDIFNLNFDFKRSTDDGASWQNITPSFYSGSIWSWAVSAHDDLYMIVDTVLYRSQDNGDTWGAVALKSIPGAIFVSKTGPVFVDGGGASFWRTTGDETTWIDIASHMPASWNHISLSSTSTGKLIFVNNLDTAYYSSTNNGDSWSKGSLYPFRAATYTIQSTSNGYLYCGYAQRYTATDIYNGFVIRSTDNGVTWDSLISGSNLIITSNDVLFETMSPDTIQYSTDFGNSWNIISLPDSKAFYNYNYYYNGVDYKGNIYWSLGDRASRYSTITKKVEEIPIPISRVSNIMLAHDGSIIAQGDGFFSVSKNQGQLWVSSIVNNDTIFPGNFAAITRDSGGGLICGGNLLIYRSTDQGTTWIQKGKVQFNQNPLLLTTSSGSIFACGTDLNIARSTDLGMTWQQSFAGLPDKISPTVVFDHNGNLYTSSGQSIYRSTNNGDTWQFMINIIDPFLIKGISTKSDVTCMAVTPNGEIFAGTTRDGIIESTDQGVTWAVVNEHLDLAQISGLYAAPNGDVYGISKGGSLDQGIIYRPYHGTRWYNANDGLGETRILQTIAFAPDGTAYLGTRGRGVWRSQGTVNAVHSSANTSNKILLNVSPNPTTSLATITYSLSNREFITLDLCDVLGKTLITLAKGDEDAGEHSAKAELNELPNGVYFVRLTTISGAVTAKMILNK